MSSDSPWNRTQQGRSGGVPPKLIIGGILGAVALVGVAIVNPFFTIGEQERAVVTTFGKFSHVAGPGVNFRIPLAQRFVELNVATQSLRVEDSETFTVDNQTVKVDFVVLFEIPDENVERIYREVPDYTRRLRDLAVDRMKIAFGRRNIAEVPQSRGLIAQEIRNVVRDEAERLLALRIIDFQLLDLEYSSAFRQAVDRSAVAKADVERAEQERRGAEVQAQTALIQARAQASQQIERARGEAEAKRLQAEVDAAAIRLRGEAEASSILAQSQALADNPGYVALRQAERWDGRLPQQLLGTAPMPFVSIQGAEATARRAEPAQRRPGPGAVIEGRAERLDAPASGGAPRPAPLAVER